MFEVGKKVIAIVTCSVFKKGDIFECLAIKKTCCIAGLTILIDLPFGNRNTECFDCGHRNPIGEAWFISRLFAPYDDTLSNITADELIEQLETVKVI